MSSKQLRASICKIDNKVSKSNSCLNKQLRVKDKFKLNIQNFNKEFLTLDFSYVLIMSIRFEDFISAIRFNKTTI